jgi:hypothetical protein
MFRPILTVLVAALLFCGCGGTTGATSLDSSSSGGSSGSTDSGAWETARQSQDDPDAIKSAEDIAGNCVMDVGTGAKICGTAAIDYCVGGLAPAEAHSACTVIVADALTPKD